MRTNSRVSLSGDVSGDEEKLATPQSPESYSGFSADGEGHASDSLSSSKREGERERRLFDLRERERRLSDL